MTQPIDPQLQSLILQARSWFQPDPNNPEGVIINGVDGKDILVWMGRIDKFFSDLADAIATEYAEQKAFSLKQGE